MSATALRSTALGESGALTLRGRDALLLPVFGRETELAFERTMRKEVDLGSVPSLPGVISNLDVDRRITTPNFGDCKNPLERLQLHHL